MRQHEPERDLRIGVPMPLQYEARGTSCPHTRQIAPTLPCSQCIRPSVPRVVRVIAPIVEPEMPPVVELDLERDVAEPRKT